MTNLHIHQTVPNQLLSRRQAAEYLGVKENTLAIWACNKRYGLPVIKVGRLCKYRVSDLDKFLDERTYAN
jgi:excisionase family DNA binding protein